MNDIDSYDFLINLFGKKNIERALDNEEATTAQVADKLFKAGNLEIPNEMQANYVLKKGLLAKEKEDNEVLGTRATIANQINKLAIKKDNT